MPSNLRFHGGVHPPGARDFSVNISSFGVPEHVARAIADADLTVYPDPQARAVCNAWARHLDVDADAVAFGPGAAQLLWDLASQHSGPQQPVLIVEPTFSEFTAAARASGARIVEWRAREEQSFAVDLSAVAELARREGVRALYLCNPNNPTGTGLPLADVARFAASLPEVLLVLDEAFLFLGELASEARVPMPSNVVRVRSMTKDLALPGLRLAYLIGAPELVRGFEERRAPWSTSAPAQAAALAALDVTDKLETQRLALLQRRTEFASSMARLGFDVLPSRTTWFLARCPSGERAAEMNARLNEHGFHARDCTSFGLPHHLRFGVRAEPDVQALLCALKEIL